MESLSPHPQWGPQRTNAQPNMWRENKMHQTLPNCATHKPSSRDKHRMSHQRTITRPTLSPINHDSQSWWFNFRLPMLFKSSMRVEEQHDGAWSWDGIIPLRTLTHYVIETAIGSVKHNARANNTEPVLHKSISSDLSFGEPRKQSWSPRFIMPTPLLDHVRGPKCRTIVH